MGKSSLHWSFGCFLCRFSTSGAYSEWTSSLCLLHGFVLYFAKRFHFLASRFCENIYIIQFYFTRKSCVCQIVDNCLMLPFRAFFSLATQVLVVYFSLIWNIWCQYQCLEMHNFPRNQSHFNFRFSQLNFFSTKIFIFAFWLIKLVWTIKWFYIKTILCKSYLFQDVVYNFVTKQISRNMLYKIKF